MTSISFPIFLYSLIFAINLNQGETPFFVNLGAGCWQRYCSACVPSQISYNKSKKLIFEIEMHSKDFIERMKNSLLEEKERLQEELDETPAHTDLGTDEDAEAQGFELDEVNQDIIAQLKEDLGKIDAALERIQKGGYGVCLVGGEDIPEPRLEAIPWADSCVDHENQK